MENDDEPRNLAFDSRKKLNTSSSANIKMKQKAPALSGQNSRPLSSNQQLYEREQRMVQNRKRNVINDDAYIKKVQKFNEFLERKKMS